MEQRQLRLGDILDDYCPRERRISNHAIVAMVGSVVKQTRCTTCDAEHPYKGGKLPPQRKKKDAKASLYDQVLTDVTRSDPGALAEAGPVPLTLADMSGRPVPVAPDEAPDVQPAAVAVPVVAEEGRVHRPLIRATLPRVEGQPAARPAPEFTVRQAASRSGKFHGHRAAGGRHLDRQKGRGHVVHGVPQRDLGSRPGPHRGGHPGHASHVPGMRPVPHPQHANRQRPGGRPHPGKKHSR